MTELIRIASQLMMLVITQLLGFGPPIHQKWSSTGMVYCRTAELGLPAATFGSKSKGCRRL